MDNLIPTSFKGKTLRLISDPSIFGHVNGENFTITEIYHSSKPEILGENANIKIMEVLYSNSPKFLEQLKDYELVSVTITID